MDSTHTPTLALSLTVEDTATALDFYTKALGMKELFRMPTPDGTVVHGECILGNAQIYVSCGSPEWKAAAMPAEASASCLFAINCEDPDAAYATAVAAGCEAIDEPTEQIWGYRTAIVRDPYGYRWNFRKQVEVLTPEEIEKRVAKLFSES